MKLPGPEDLPPDEPENQQYPPIGPQPGWDGTRAELQPVMPHVAFTPAEIEAFNAAGRDLQRVLMRERRERHTLEALERGIEASTRRRQRDCPTGLAWGCVTIAGILGTPPLHDILFTASGFFTAADAALHARALQRIARRATAITNFALAREALGLARVFSRPSMPLRPGPP